MTIWPGRGIERAPVSCQFVQNRATQTGRDGWDVRPHPQRPPGRGQRGRRPVRSRRGGVRAHRPAVAEAGPPRHRRRGPLPDDGHRDGGQSAVLGQPRRHRPRRRHLHQGHAARPRGAEPRHRAVLHHRRGRAGVDPVLAELGGPVLHGPFRRRQPARLRTRRRAHRRGHEGTARRRAEPGRGARAGDLVDRLPPSRRERAGPSGTWCPTASCSTSPSAGCTRRRRTSTREESASDRNRRSHHDGDDRRPGGRRQARRRRRRHRRVRTAGHHRLLRDRVGVQRPAGQRDRRRGRGEDARGRLQAGPPRGHPGGPLGAAGLRRHRRAHPASGRAQLLRARPAVAGLPGGPSRSGRCRSEGPPAGAAAARADRVQRGQPDAGPARHRPDRPRPRPGGGGRRGAGQAAAAADRVVGPAPRLDTATALGERGGSAGGGRHPAAGDPSRRLAGPDPPRGRRVAPGARLAWRDDARWAPHGGESRVDVAERSLPLVAELVDEPGRVGCPTTSPTVRSCWSRTAD